MRDEARERELEEAMQAALREQAAAQRYRLNQVEATSGRAGATDGARPLEFDESGFPVPQGNPGFARRVARLLSLY
jgi:hypothetical protein